MLPEYSVYIKVKVWSSKRNETIIKKHAWKIIADEIEDIRDRGGWNPKDKYVKTIVKLEK